MAHFALAGPYYPWIGPARLGVARPGPRPGHPGLAAGTGDIPATTGTDTASRSRAARATMRPGDGLKRAPAPVKAHDDRRGRATPGPHPAPPAAPSGARPQGLVTCPYRGPARTPGHVGKDKGAVTSPCRGSPPGRSWRCAIRPAIGSALAHQRHAPASPGPYGKGGHASFARSVRGRRAFGIPAATLPTVSQTQLSC